MEKQKTFLFDCNLLIINSLSSHFFSMSVCLSVCLCVWQFISHRHFLYWGRQNRKPNSDFYDFFDDALFGNETNFGSCNYRAVYCLASVSFFLSLSFFLSIFFFSCSHCDRWEFVRVCWLATISKFLFHSDLIIVSKERITTPFFVFAFQTLFELVN